jgi:Cysteine-rich CPCC
LTLQTRFACPCCGFVTLDQEPPGTYMICEVCFWEDDGVQFRDPDYRGGANKVSLNEARENFRVDAVSELRFRSKVRSPRPEERP